MRESIKPAMKSTSQDLILFARYKPVARKLSKANDIALLS